VRDYPDGQLEVLYQGSVIKSQEAPAKPGLFRPRAAMPAGAIAPVPAWLQDILIRGRAATLEEKPIGPPHRHVSRRDGMPSRKRNGRVSQSMRSRSALASVATQSASMHALSVRRSIALPPWHVYPALVSRKSRLDPGHVDTDKIAKQ
jgi:hypothetical protein